MKHRHSTARLECSICRSKSSRLLSYLDGYVCDECTEKTCVGTDSTSRALRMQQCADSDHLQQIKGERSWISAEELEYRAASNQLMSEEILSHAKPSARLGSGGEVVNPKVTGLVNTLNDPGVAATEASYHRTDLVTSLGNDIAAMALDASDTISASNSLEKMLAHQMAALHEAGMQMFRRANLMEDHAVAAKCIGSGIKACTAYQGALATLDKVRGDKRQHIVVQHVNVGAGGQAVVGNVNARGGQHA